MIRFAAISLLCLADLAAQPAQSPKDQHLAGSLVAVQPDSIAVKLNDKVTTVRLDSDTEIWRRGIDLTDPSQLALGDDVYILYARTASDGAPIATLVAAAEEGDVVELISYHVIEHRVCGGHLKEIGANTISIESDDGVCTMRFTPKTAFWRGESRHDPSGFVLGDAVSARAIVNYLSGELIAEDVEANVAKFSGKITKVGPNGVEMINEDEQGNPIGPCTVLVDARTIFDEGTLQDLRVGALLEVIGLDLGHDSMRATTIMTLRLSASPSPKRR